MYVHYGAVYYCRTAQGLCTLCMPTMVVQATVNRNPYSIMQHEHTYG